MGKRAGLMKQLKATQKRAGGVSKKTKKKSKKSNVKAQPTTASIADVVGQSTASTWGQFKKAKKKSRRAAGASGSDAPADDDDMFGMAIAAAVGAGRQEVERPPAFADAAKDAMLQQVLQQAKGLGGSASGLLRADAARAHQEELKRLSALKKEKKGARLFGPAQARAQRLANAASAAASDAMDE